VCSCTYTLIYLYSYIIIIYTYIYINRHSYIHINTYFYIWTFIDPFQSIFSAPISPPRTSASSKTEVLRLVQIISKFTPIRSYIPPELFNISHYWLLKKSGYTLIYTNIRIFIYMCIYIHIYVYIHIYMYAYTNS
jgi:hypothetical protein